MNELPMIRIMSEQQGTVISINVGPGGIPKRPVESIAVGFDGLEGDGHDHDKHNTPMQAVSLLDVENLDDLRAEGFVVAPGAMGENITCRGLDVDRLSVGDRLCFTGGLEIELSKRRTPCFVLDAIDPQLKVAAAGRIGFYAKVITPAVLTPDETITVINSCDFIPLKDRVSDSANTGS